MHVTDVKGRQHAHNKTETICILTHLVNRLVTPYQKTKTLEWSLY